MTDRRFTLHGLLLYISFITSYGRAQCASSCFANVPYNYDIKNVWCVPGALKAMAPMNPYCPGVQVAPKGFSFPTVCSTVNQNGYTQVCPTLRGIYNSITQPNAIAINEASGKCYSNIKTPVIPSNAMSQETRIAMKKSPGNYMYPDIPKPFKATIHACLAGYDGEIFEIINEIKKTTGTEIEVHFYLFHRCKFNHLGSHLTNVKCLQEALAKYHHYICLNKKYVETYSEKEHCWYIEKLIMIPAFHKEVDLLDKNIPMQDFTKICDASNKKTGFEPLLLEIDEKVGDKKDIQKIKETENKYEICIDHIQDICENNLGVNKDICTKSSQENLKSNIPCGSLDASLEKNQMIRPVNFQGNFVAQTTEATNQRQNICKNVNLKQNGYVVAKKQAQENMVYDIKYSFPQPAQDFENNVYMNKPCTFVEDRSNIPMSYSNGAVCNAPCGNIQNGQAQKANLWFKNVAKTNLEMPIGYNVMNDVNNNKNYQRILPCYHNNVFSSYINNQNNIHASNICKYKTKNPTNIVDKLTTDCFKIGSIIPNLIPLKVNRICQTMNNVITSPINDAIRNMPCGLIVPETRNMKSVSSENSKNLNYLSYSKPYPNICEWVNYGSSNIQMQNTGRFKYDTVVPKSALQTDIPTVCSTQNQPCMINQNQRYSTVVPYSPIVKLVTPLYDTSVSYMQPCVASQRSQNSVNEAYITSYAPTKTSVPVCGSISSSTQKNIWPVPESVTVCYTQPAKIPICASSLFHTQNQQTQKSIWPLQYSGAANVCQAQSLKSVVPEFVCASPSGSESISPQRSFKQICGSNSFYTQRQNNRQSKYQQSFVSPQRICLSPGIWQKQGYRTTVPYAQPTYTTILTQTTPSTKAVLPTICAEPVVPVCAKQNSGPTTTYVETKANYNTVTAYRQPQQGWAQEYNTRGSGYSLSDNRALAVGKKQDYDKICISGKSQEGINGHNKIYSYTQAKNNLGSKFWTSLSQRPAKICASSNVGVTPRYDAISTYTEPMKSTMQSQIYHTPAQKSMLPQKLDYDIIGSYTQPQSLQTQVHAIFPFVRSEKGISPQTGVKNEYVSIDLQAPKSQKPDYGSVVSYIPTQIGVKPNYDMISGYTLRPKSVQSDYIPLESNQKIEPGNYESISVPGNSLNIGYDTATLSPKSGFSEKGSDVTSKNLYPLSQVKYQETPIGQYTGTPGLENIKMISAPKKAVWPSYQKVRLDTSSKNVPNEETYTMSDYTPAQKRMQAIAKSRNNVIDSYTSPSKSEGQIYKLVQSNIPIQSEQFAPDGTSIDNAVTEKERKPELDVISSYAPWQGKLKQDVVDSYNPSQDSLKNNYDKVPIGTLFTPIQPTHSSVSYAPSESYNGIPTEVRNEHNTISSYTQPQRRITPEYLSLLPCDQKLTSKPGFIVPTQDNISGILPKIGSAYDTISSYTQPQRKITPDYISFLPCDRILTSKPGFIVPTQDNIPEIPQEIGNAYDTISSYTQPQRRITPNYVSLYPCDQKLTLKSGFIDPTKDTIPSYTQPQRKITPNYISLLPCDQKLTSKPGFIVPTQDSISGIPQEIGNAYDTISSYTLPQSRITTNYVSLLPCDQKLNLKPDLRDPTQDSILSGIPPEIGNAYDTIPSYTQPQRKITPNYISFLPCDQKLTSKPGFIVSTQDSIPQEIENAYDTISSYTQPQRKITPDYISLLPCDQKLTSKPGLIVSTQDSISGIPPKIGSAYDTISSYTHPQGRITPEYVSLLPSDQKLTSKAGFIVPTQDSVSGISPGIGRAYDTISSYTQPQRGITPNYVSLLPCDQKLTSEPGFTVPTQDSISGIPPKIGSAYDTISSYTQPQRKITRDYISFLPCDQKLTSKPGFIVPTQDSVSGISPGIGSAYDTIPSYTQPQRKITPDYISFLPCDQKLTSKPGFIVPIQDSIPGIPQEIENAYDTISSYTQPQRRITPNYVSLLPCDQKLNLKPDLRDPTQDSILCAIPPEIGNAYDTIPFYIQPQRKITPDYISFLPCDQKLTSKPGFIVPTQDSTSGIPSEIGNTYDTMSSYTQPQRRITPNYVSLLPCDQKLYLKPDLRDPTQYSVSGIPSEVGTAYDTISSYTQPQRKITPNYVSLLPCDQKLSPIQGLRDSTQDSVSGIPSEIGSAYDTISSYTQKIITPNYVSLLPGDQKLTSKPTEDNISEIQPEIGSACDSISSYTQPQRRITPDFISLLPCDQKLSSIQGLRNPTLDGVSRIPPEIESTYDTISSYTQPHRKNNFDYSSYQPCDGFKPGLKVPLQDSVSRLPSEIGSAYDTISSYTQPQRKITPNYVSLLPCDQKLSSIQGLRDPTQDSVSRIPAEIGSAFDTISSYTEPQRRITPDYVSLLPCDQKRNWKPSLRDPTQDRVSRIPPEISIAYDSISSYTQPQSRITPDYASFLPGDQKLTSKPGIRDLTQYSVSGTQPEIGSAYDTISSYTQPQRRITADYVSLMPCDQKFTSKPGLRHPTYNSVLPEIESTYDTITTYSQPQRRITPDYVSLLPCDQKLTSKPSLRNPTQDRVSGILPEIGSAYDTISSYTQPQRKITSDYLSYGHYVGSKPGSKGPSQDIVSGIPPEIGSAYERISSYTQPQRRIAPEYVSILPCDLKLNSKTNLRDSTQDSVSKIPPEVGSAYDTISSYTQPQRNIPPGYDSSQPGDDFSSSRPQYDSLSSNAEDENEKIPAYTKYPSRLSRIDPILYNVKPEVKPGRKDQQELNDIISYTQEPKSIIPDLNLPCSQPYITPSMSAVESFNAIPSYTQQPRSFKQIYDKIAPHLLLQHPKTTITGYEPLNYAQPSVTPQRIEEKYDFIPSFTSQPKSTTSDNENILSYTKPCVTPKDTLPSVTGYDSVVSYIQPQKSIQLEYGNPKITSPEFVSYKQTCPIPKDVQQNYDTIKSYSQYPKSSKQAYDSISSYTQPKGSQQRYKPSVTKPAKLDTISSFTQYPKTMELEYTQPVVTAKDYNTISRYTQAPIENYDTVTSYAETPKSIRPTHQSISSYSRPCITPIKSTQQKISDQIVAYTKDNRQKEDYLPSENAENLPRYEPTVFEEPSAAPVKDNYETIASYTETPKIQDQEYGKTGKPGYETVPSYTQPFEQKSKPIYNTIQRYTQPTPNNLQQQVYMQNSNIRRPSYVPVSYIKPNVCIARRICPIYNKISSYTPTIKRVKPRYESIQYTQPKLSPAEANQPYNSISSYNQVPNLPSPKQLNLQYQPILSYTQPCVSLKKGMFVTPRYQSIPTYTKQTVQPIPRYDHIQSYTQPRVPTQSVYPSNQPCNYQSIPSYTKQILPLKAYDQIQSYSQPSKPTQPIYESKTPRAYESIASYTEPIVPIKPRHDHIQSYTQPGVSTEPLYPSKQLSTPPCVPEIVTSYKTMSQKPTYENIQSYTQPSLPIQPVYPIGQPMTGAQREPCLPDIISSYETLANNVYVTPGKNYVEYDIIKAYEPQKNTRQRYRTDPAQTDRTTAPVSEPILQYTRPSTPSAFKNKNYDTIGSYTLPQKNINDISDQIMLYTRPQQGEQIFVSPQTSSSQYYDTIGSYTQVPKGINDIGNQIKAYVKPQIEQQTYVTSNRENIQDNDIIASYTQPPKSMKDICDQIMSHSKPQTGNPTYLTPSITNNQSPYNQQQGNIKDICDQIKSYIEPLESQEQYAPILKYSQTINDGKQLSDTISEYEKTPKNAERVCDEIESYKNIKANEVRKQDNDQVYSFAQPWQRVNNQIPNMKPQAKDLYDQISAYTQPPKNLNPISEYINAPQSPNQGYGPTLTYTQPQKMATENYDTISSYAQPQERVVAPCVPLQKIPQPIIDRINSYTQPTKNGQVPYIPLKETVRVPCMLQQESSPRPYDTISDYTRIPKDDQQVVMPYVPLQERSQEIYDNIPSYTQPSVNRQMPYVPLQKLTPSEPCIPLPDTVTYTLPKSFKQTYDSIPTYTSIPKGSQGMVPCVPPQESPKETCDTINSYTQPLISENVYIPLPESYRGIQSEDAPITPPQRSQGRVFEAINSYTKPRQNQENRQVCLPCLSQICPQVSEQQVRTPYKPLQTPGELEYIPCIQSLKPAPSVDLPWLPQESAQRVCVPWTLPEQRGRKIYAPCVSDEKLEPSICVPYTMPQQSRKEVCVPYTTFEIGGQDTVPYVQLKPAQPICAANQKPQNSYKLIYDTIPAYTHAPKIPVRVPSYKPAPQICNPCFPQQRQQVSVPCMPPEEIVEEVRSPCQKPQTSFKQAYDTISAYTKPPKREQVCLPCIPQQNSRSPEYVQCILQKPSEQVCMPCIPQPNSGQVCLPCIPFAASELPGKTFKQMYDTIAAYKQPSKDRPQTRLPYTQEFSGQVYEPYMSQKPCQQVRVPYAPTYKPSSQICVPCMPENIGQQVCVPCQPSQKSFDEVTAYTQPREIGRVYEPCIPLETNRQVYEPCISRQPISVPCIPQKTTLSIPRVRVPCVPQVDRQQMYAPQNAQITAYTEKPEIGRVFEPCLPQQKLEQVHVPSIPQKDGQPICIPCVPQVDRQKMYVPCQPPQKSFKEVYDVITTYTQKPEIGRVFEPCVLQGSGSKMPCTPQDNKQQVCMPCVQQLGSVEEICVPYIPTQKPRQQICVPCVPQANGQQVCMPCIPQAGRQKVCIPCVPQDNRQQVCMPCIPQDNRPQVRVPCQPPQKSFKEVYDAISAYTQPPESGRVCEPCILTPNSRHQVCTPCVPQLGSVEEICVPCIPTQKPRQQICVPCIPQVNGKQVCWPCVAERSGLVCEPCMPQKSGQVCVPCMPCIPQNNRQQVCVPCIPQDNRQGICVPCIPQDNRQAVCVPCIPQDNRQGVCVPCIPQDNRQGVCVPCIPQDNRQGVCVPCIPQDNRQGVCVPCIPQDNRQGVCVPCIPQDNRQGVCVPCIPQDNRQGVCVPCIPQDNRQGVCVPCIPQDNRQGVCVPCIPQDNRQGVCVPCIPQDNRQGVYVPCIPQDNRQGVCVPCIPQDNRQGVCVPCVPQDNRQAVCVPCIPQDNRQGVCVPCIPQDNSRGVCVPCIPQKSGQRVCTPCMPQDNTQVCTPCLPWQDDNQQISDTVPAYTEPQNVVTQIPSPYLPSTQESYPYFPQNPYNSPNSREEFDTKPTEGQQDTNYQEPNESTTAPKSLIDCLKECITKYVTSNPNIKNDLYNNVGIGDLNNITLDNLAVLTNFENKTAFMTKNIGSNIQLKGFMNKVKIIRPKLVLETQEIEVPNFIPVVTSNENRCQCVIQGLAKAVVETAYSQPVLIKKPSSMDNGYMMVKDKGVSSSNAIIWPAVYQDNAWYKESKDCVCH